MNIRPIIITTEKTNWFLPTFSDVYESVTLTKGLTIEPFASTNIEPPVSIPIRVSGKKRKVDWNWFYHMFTAKYGAEYNCIVFHTTTKYRKKWGLTTTIGGTYRADRNPYIEIYICADTVQRFAEVMKHEILHFIERTLNNNVNIKTNHKNIDYPSRTHAYAYGLKDLDACFRTFNFSEWNSSRDGMVAQLREKLSKLLLALKFINKKSMYPLERQQFVYKVSQRFGKPSSSYKSGIHAGTDFSVVIGTNVYAPCDDFEVYEVFRRHESMGNACYARCTIDGVNWWFRFLHLVRPPSIGMYKKGDVFAQTGNTGMSEGPHLHMDQWKVPVDSSLLYSEKSVRTNLVDTYAFFLEKVDGIVV